MVEAYEATVRDHEITEERLIRTMAEQKEKRDAASEAMRRILTEAPWVDIIHTKRQSEQ